MGDWLGGRGCMRFGVGDMLIGFVLALFRINGYRKVWV